MKALTEFPSVLDNLAKNLTWTSSLGEAYHNQPSEVMEAIQTLRAKAKAAGNLKSSSQITVVQQTPQTIVIQPANPQVVYVPEYNPAVIYGMPYVIPGYTAADVAAAGVIGFGAGIAVGALAGVADGDGIPGTVTGMVARWFTTTTTSTETLPGTVATTTAATTLATATTTPTTRPQSITSIARIRTTSTPTVRTHGPTTRAHSENRTRLVAWVIASAVMAAGHREPTASAAGGACVPAVSAVADSAVAASAVEVSGAVGFDVKRPLKRILMSHFISKHKMLTFTLLVSLASCSKPVEPSKPSVEKVVPKNFASPSEAGAALLAAAQSGDRAALLEIFGPGGEEILFTRRCSA